ncbi:uncharacterized protein MONOS_2618 [Monocercomonoides exilis]|uniref:uncharacterized protein n=1 Tax=Monocercomonoides exilis TaxID=2049356 RepID=UPI00355998EA|nr:hypothetical protein MONOS_2618 [Monocercomonoides exilis]|eukprot:MONOS_2618.1-p1 / transcript=MONOS_2618.1 / gene=MONOS_2618 / organism=Monocercomonoides_exilis_PA203 / gene_product=unspecified product / transcript_product=unspecified product / location=Mono_scaffold00055:54723-55001(+) / protein_length=93 / sequence_SO=supercontig / SO=protein_coding / is_pseudo=false
MRSLKPGLCDSSTSLSVSRTASVLSMPSILSEGVCGIPCSPFFELESVDLLRGEAAARAVKDLCAERELRKEEGELGEFDCSEGAKEEGLSS